MADDRPKISGHIPAAGAPLTSRTLALQPGQQSVTQGDTPWSSQIANAVYDWLGAHGPADMPEEGRQNIANAAGSASTLLPPVAANEALTSARQGDFPGVVSNLAGVLPIIPGAKGATAVKDVGESVAGALVKRATMADVSSIRGLPVAEGIEAARSEPHLIPAGDQSKGYFIGGPQDIQSPEDLAQRRSDFDAYLAPELRGQDWYDRYRAGMNRATGGDPEMNKWMSNTQGSWSAGVSPESETAFAIKEANSALAGQPVKAYMGGAHEDFLNAIAAGDPDMMRLGPKTGEYASLVNPDQPGPPGATGVNDFRMANQFGYTPGEATIRKGEVSLTAPQHTFMDYETALMADRANQTQLGGKTDWTGEQIQAVPWVRQKAEALMKLRPGLDYESAITEANKTAPDFFEKHAANATWEAQPGPATGHLPGSLTASPEDRAAYMDAPGSWAVAPSVGLQEGELPRDAIYGGLQLGDTGVGMYTLPSRPMTGVFEGENNPGVVARPLVAFDTGGGSKTVSPADQSILNAGETVRSAFGAQNAGAWNKSWVPDRVGAANSFLTPLNRPATVEELLQNEAAGKGYGMPMSTDTGGGILTTNFGDPQGWKPAERKAAVTAMQAAAPTDAAGPGGLMKTDSGYIDLEPAWKQGVGSGAVTQKMLDAVNATPELREAFNQNALIPDVASAQAERDAVFAPQWDGLRDDLQNLRLVAGQGPGWVDRVQQGLDTYKATGTLPALAGGAAVTGAVFTPTAGFPAQPDQQPSAPIGSSPQYDDWWRQLQQQRFDQAS
jgi:hypothetical protein